MLSSDARNWRTLTWFRLELFGVQTGGLSAVNTGGCFSMDRGLIWSSLAFAFAVLELLLLAVLLVLRRV